MFSLQKNFIKEQQKLVNDIQDELIQANIQNAKLEELLASHERFVVYFKKVAQILSHYHPEHNEVGNIILQIVDHCNIEECKEDLIESLENRIDKWEESLIERKKEIEESKEPETEVTDKPVENEVNIKEDSSADKGKVVESFGGIVLVDEE